MAIGLSGVGGGIYLTTTINESLAQGIVGISLIALSVMVSSYLIYESGAQHYNPNNRFFKMPINNNNRFDEDVECLSPLTPTKSNSSITDLP